MSAPSPNPIPWKGLGHLVIVYLCWGSTYLAIRYAVQDGSGFPPFAMAASRMLVGGLILFALARLLRHRIRVTRDELIRLAVTGILLWNAGHGLVVWAEQRAHSGYAALVVGTSPMWAALMEAALDRRRPAGGMLVGLAIGFAGLVVLTLPVLRTGARADSLATLALMLAPVGWSAGSILLQRRPLHLSPLVVGGYQQIIGAAVFASVMLLRGEPWPHPTAQAWAGWWFLIVFGSVLSFTSFIKALRMLPISVVMTYAYVNPLVAMTLGCLLAGEPLTTTMLGGMALILAGVAAVFHDRFRRPPAPAR